MISKNDKIDPGYLKLQKKAEPPLKADKYTLKSQLVLKGVPTEAGKDPSFSNHSTTFVVEAPRYTIEPGLINSVYPLADSAGAYSNSLPHIIMNRKTIPWERTITGTSPEPWMALLLLSDKEVEDNKVALKTMKAVELPKGDSKLVAPDIDTNSWQTEDEIRVMELPVNLFKAICPKKEELPFLCHTRQVDMTLKENADTNPKGWFSVVAGNRLPQDEQLNHVFLVSLEGHNTALTQAGNANQHIRLAVLHQWAFQEKGKTFGELIKDLLQDKNIDALRINASSDNADANKALNLGYMPMNHQWRNGKRSVCWYRGPLVPVNIPSPQPFKYRSADQALRFDKAMGMFDISYASAWQLGRMLALQNKEFSQALVNWKTSYNRNKPLMVARSILVEEKVIELEKLDELDEMVQDVVSDEILTDFILELWDTNKLNQ